MSIRELGGHWFWWAFVVVYGQPPLFVDSHLHFLAGRGDRAFVGCHWHWVSCCGCHWQCCWVVVVVH